MKKIPTAEEFFSSYCNNRNSTGRLNGFERLDILKEFAKMHVENFATEFNLSTEYRKHLVDKYIDNIK